MADFSTRDLAHTCSDIVTTCFKRRTIWVLWFLMCSRLLMCFDVQIFTMLGISHASPVAPTAVP